MALRWDLRPVFPNAPEDSDAARITRRTVISGTVALTALITVSAIGVPWYVYLIVVVGMVAAFDSADHAVPFEGDGELFEEVEDPDADRPLTAREKLYRPVEER